MLATEELLKKALFNVSGPGSESADFGGPTQSPLSLEQVTQFIELLSEQQVMLSRVRRVMNSSAKWQESIISFSERITRPGIEGTRLAEADRAKPGTGLVELSSHLLRAEVPVSDEVMEDNVAGRNIIGSLERLITERFGRDVEELMINGDTTNTGDSYLALLDGWLARCLNDGNPIDGSSYGQDYQEIFRTLLMNVPLRFLAGLEQSGAYYVPKRLEQKYRDILAARGTSYGDIMLTGTNQLVYQGIPIVGVPLFAVDSIAGTSKVLLCNSQNLYAGFHRSITFETWRDPREGATSFIVTSRVDAQVAVPEATVCAHDVDINP